MRLLMLAQFFPPDIGGEERHVLNLANTLAARGHVVSVGTQRLDGAPDEEVLPSGVRVHRFATAAMRLPGVYSTGRPHHPPAPDPLGVRALARIVRRERPDVVHAHNWIVNSAVALRRRPAGAPRFGLVLTLHDYSMVCATKRLMRREETCPGPALRRCGPCTVDHYGPVVGPVTLLATAAMRPWKLHALDHIVSVSQAVADGNRLPTGPDHSVIPNFVPDSALVGTTKTAPAGRASVGDPDLPGGDYLLFVGDLSLEKGVHTLLAAYEALGPDRPPLLLIGRRTPDTPERLPDGARLLVEWPHERVVAAFRRCLFAVLPSIWPDPCPTTVLEAMACGRPVVTTSIGGMVDMVVDGQSGLLVRRADEVELAQTMRRLLADPQLRVRLGAGALERVREFTASRVAERLETIYARVAPVGARPGRPPQMVCIQGAERRG